MSAQKTNRNDNIKTNKIAGKEAKNVTKGKRIRKHIVRFFLVLLFVFLLACIFLGIKYGSTVIKYKKEAKELVEAGGEDIFKKSLTSIVYDKDGNVIAELNGSKDSYYLTSNKIPYIVKKAFIVSEDRKFYDHGGVDYSAVMRAFVALVQNDGEVTQGGSTITQQLARNIYLTHEVSIERKLKEIFIAWELEDIYTKDEILEFYINNIYFANGLYGIESAAESYFNKSASELTTSEMVFLCAIPNNPTLYDPLEKMENTLKRRDRILKQMYDYGEIDQETYIDAINEGITLTPSEKIVNNYVETFIRYSATLELMKLDGFLFKYQFESDEEKEEYTNIYNEEYSKCNGLLFTGGYRIYTTIDMNKQNVLQKTLDNALSNYEETGEDGVYSFQGSATCIDNSTGYVVAIVGGRSQDSEGYTLNRAYQSHRQPGSSIKPLLVYTPMFERGYTPNTLVVDEKIEGGPQNATKTYVGKTNIRTAVEQSINTIAWKLLEGMGISNGLTYLQNMKFGKIVESDYVPAVAIGGFTYGVSTLEMASGYSTIANDGIYRDPTCIRRIKDSLGNIILDNGSNTINQKKIYQTNASRMMTNVLEGVLAGGTGRKYNINNAICAGKTGTTNDTKDVWFVGYSTYYTTAVWCGYDIPKEINDGYGNTCAGLIWKDFMEEIHTGLEKKNFLKYFDTISEYPEYEQETTTNPDKDNKPTTDPIENTTMPNESTSTSEISSAETTINNAGTTHEDITHEDTTDIGNNEQYTTVGGEDGMYTEKWE